MIGNRYLLIFGLPQYILDSLEGNTNCFEILGAVRVPRLRERFRALQSVYNVVGIGDEYIVDHIVGITVSLFQIKLQALPEEYAHRTGVVGVRKLLLRLGS